MLQRDYIMRLIAEFFKTLERLLHKREPEKRREALEDMYRQYVGEDASFDIQVTGRARSYVSSLDNMGGVITVFEY